MSAFSPFRSLPPLPIPNIVRRRCFISYFHGDKLWAKDLVTRFGGTNGVFVPRLIGLDGDAIQSTKPNYVINTIREEYISGSTVSIVLLGPCTHSRRFANWGSERTMNGNGLLGIILPPSLRAYLPDRFANNWRQDDTGYAALRLYPQSGAQLQVWINDVVWRSTARRAQMCNTQDVWAYNQKCATCGFTH